MSLSKLRRRLSRLRRRIFRALSQGIFLVGKPFVQRKDGKESLVILRLDGIGDAVLFSGTLRYFRERFPEFEITVVVRTYVAGLFTHCPYVDNVFTWDNTRDYRILHAFYRAWILLRLCRKNVRIVIDSMWTRDDIADDMIAAMNPQTAVVFSPTGTEPSTKGKARIAVAVPTTIVRELDRYPFLLAALGLNVSVENIAPEVWFSVQEQVAVARLLRNRNVQDYFVAVPAAGYRIKMWPEAKWLEALSQMIQRSGLSCVLLGGERDQKYCSALHRKLNSPHVVDLSGLLTLTEAAALLSSAKIYVGADTGLWHIARAVGTKTVCIMGGGHYGRFSLGEDARTVVVHKFMDCYYCEWNCKYDTALCIEEIEVEDVIRAVMKGIA